MTDKDEGKIETVYSDIIADRLSYVKAQEARTRARRRIQLSAMSAVALAASTLAVFSLVFETLSLTISNLAPLIMALLGVLVSIVTLFFRDRDRERQNLHREIYHIDTEKMQLIREWIAFESISRKIVSPSHGRNSPIRLSDIIDYLSSHGIIGELDRGILLASLRSRNEIVHTGESGLSPSEENLLLERLSDINRTLFNELREPSNKDLKI